MIPAERSGTGCCPDIFSYLACVRDAGLVFEIGIGFAVRGQVVYMKNKGVA
jgi:hypothetical protein